MKTRNSDRPEQAVGKRLSFDRYVLDLDRGSLLLDGNEIALRPKTFAVLQFLVENKGRLVSKDEVFAAVWANIAVTDDALVQSVGELRRALGHDGPRLIRTVPRRGYRFDAAVARADPASADHPAVSAASQDGAPPSGRTHDTAVSPADPPAHADGATLAAPCDGTRSSSLHIRARASRLLGKTLSGWRLGPLAALALVILIAATAVWTGSSLDLSAPSAPRPDVQSTKTAEVAARPTMAILPLVNGSDDPAREYFSDGMTQDLIAALGRFTALTVMSWNAVLPYKGKPASPGEIARSLGVRYQVEGSVRQAGGRVRVTAQLVDQTGRVIWSSRFEEAFADLFALQDKITTEIAGALAIRVTQVEQRRVFAKPTESLEAYDFVLRARPALQRPSRANNVEARALLRRAIQLDPGYATAYAALAETYHIATSWGWAESPFEFMSRAEEMATKALRLNDSELRARIVLGRVHLFHHRYEEAKAEMERVIAINPSDAHGLAGRGNILMWLGQTDEAIEVLELAQRIDPELNAVDRFSLSMAYYLKRRYDAAIAQAQLNLRNSESSHFSHIVLAAAYAQLGRSDDVARVVATIRRTNPTFNPQEFGSKLRNPADLEHVRDGLRKAGF
jgi:adenylate cyclase